jgi:hypothetical protein
VLLDPGRRHAGHRDLQHQAQRFVNAQHETGANAPAGIGHAVSIDGRAR